MTVHSFHIFDRKGKTLFTKRYMRSPSGRGAAATDEAEEEHLSEQRKLIFGMLFSLRELCGSLSPLDGPDDLQMVKTGGSILYNYETVSGLRFVLYTTPETSTSIIPSLSATTTRALNLQGGGGVGGSSSSSSAAVGLGGGVGVGGLSFGGGGSGAGVSNTKVTESIRGALKHIYEHIWVTFVVRSPMYRPTDPDIGATNFEASLDNYLKGMPWFR